MVLFPVMTQVSHLLVRAQKTRLQSPQTQIESQLVERRCCLPGQMLSIPGNFAAILFSMKKMQTTVQTMPSSYKNTFFIKGLDVQPKEAFAGKTSTEIMLDKM